jgi:hypothetical protein
MYSFAHSLKIHCTVQFQHSLPNDSAYTVRSVSAIVIWIFHRNAFKLWLCDILQYQNHKTFPPLRYQNTAVYYRCVLRIIM